MPIVTIQRDASIIFNSFLPKTNSIMVKKTFLENPKYASIINSNNLSALDNYLTKEKAILRLDILEGDLFHNLKCTIYKKNVIDEKSFIMKIDESKDKFVETMRGLYKNVVQSIESLKN